MTHKKLIDNISSEMKQLKEKERQDLEEINNRTDLTDEQKKITRKCIIETFQKNMRSFKEREWYEEALISARKMKQSKLNLKKAETNMEKTELNFKKAKEELLKAQEVRNDQYYSYKQAQLIYWWDAVETINWDFNIALDYLKKYCRDIKEWVEYNWKQFNKISIKLPNWNKQDFFVETWDSWNNGKWFKENGYVNYSFSRKDIKNILNNIKNFLISAWVDPYEETETNNKKHKIDRSDICLKHLLWLEENKWVFDEWGAYRLKDKLLGVNPNYYQLVSYPRNLEFERWCYNYWDFWQNDIWKLLLKSLPKEN